MNRRLSTTVMLAALLGAVLPAAHAAEEAYAIEQLEASRAALLEATEGLSEAQWRFRESEDRWSAAEIVEHLALSEDFLFAMLTDEVMRTERRDEPLPGAAEADGEIVAMTADRSQQFQAPEPLQPTQRFETPQAAMKQFLDSRARTIEFVRETPDLRFYAMEAPGGVERDAVQWSLFIAGHTVRHTSQLQQVKDHPDFP